MSDATSYLIGLENMDHCEGGFAHNNLRYLRKRYEALKSDVEKRLGRALIASDELHTSTCYQPGVIKPSTFAASQKHFDKMLDEIERRLKSGEID